MKLTDAQRRLSLEMAESLKSTRHERLEMATIDRNTGTVQKYSVREVLEALKSHDQTKIADINAMIREQVRHGHLSELRQTFDLLLATAGTNEAAGLPIHVEVDPAGWGHLQRSFIQAARAPVDRSHRLLLHPIEEMTEKLGELHRSGIVKLWSFEAFADPIIGQLLQVSFDSADKLRQFVDSGRKLEEKNARPRGELQGKQYEKDTAGTKLDGDVGGKKPVSKNGSHTLLCEQISLGRRPAGRSAPQSTRPAQR